VRTQRVAYGPSTKPAGTAVAKVGQPVSSKPPVQQVAQLGEPVSQPQPEIVQTAASEPAPEPPTPSSMTPAVDTSLPPGTEVLDSDPRPPRSGFARGEDGPPRRSFVDITASTCYAHADDYSWLRGEVEYSRISKGWRLRYASVDEDDKYGGSVTLSGETEKLKDGMHIMVKGQMQNPEARGISPLYHADSVEMVEKKD
jgi:hypothetical protein